MPSQTANGPERSIVPDFETTDRVLAARSGQAEYELNEAEVQRLLAASGIGGFGAKIPKPGGDPVVLSIGISRSREFGMLISAGVGGACAGLYNDSCRTEHALVSASVELTDGETFLELFQGTIAGKKLALGGGAAITIQLEALFACLIELANHYSPTRPGARHVIERLELNPIFVQDGELRIAKSQCRCRAPAPVPAPRPIEKIGHMLHPDSIGIIGVSATKMNFGRIILKNLLDSGYDRSRMLIIRPGETEIDGVKCAAELSSLQHKLDLLIVAVGAEAVFDLVDEIITADAAESVMLIPGGLGETEASRERAARMSQKMNEAHRHGDGGPVFLGGNCLGIVSHPGSYDSWFIPKYKLPKGQKKAQRNSALVSQSGAFMITRISQHPWFDPAYMTAVGNQNDLTHSDMVNYFADQDGIDLIGVYAEGFKDLDGLDFVKAVRKAVIHGKQVVVYKAGRSGPGQVAALGHTASIAGDYAVCRMILRQAGAIVADTFTEFNDLFYVADCLRGKNIGGNRLGAVSGAGFEAVGMADSIHADGFSLRMGSLSAATYQRLEEVLKAKKLDVLMEIRNPLDINPAADDEAHALCTQALADDPGIDAVVVGLDPLSPVMRTLPESPRRGFDINSDDSITRQLPELVAAQDKPIIGIVDGGSMYDPMIEQLKDRGVCIFRSCDQGVRALAKYIEARLNAERIKQKCSTD